MDFRPIYIDYQCRVRVVVLYGEVRRPVVRPGSFAEFFLVFFCFSVIDSFLSCLSENGFHLFYDIVFDLFPSDCRIEVFYRGYRDSIRCDEEALDLSFVIQFQSIVEMIQIGMDEDASMNHGDFWVEGECRARKLMASAENTGVVFDVKVRETSFVKGLQHQLDALQRRVGASGNEKAVVEVAKVVVDRAATAKTPDDLQACEKSFSNGQLGPWILVASKENRWFVAVQEQDRLRKIIAPEKAFLPSSIETGVCLS